MLDIKKLRELENEGKYLFHGSVHENSSVFEPRQAYTIREGKKVEDDKPGIHTTPNLDIAIFMATVSPRNTNCKNFRSSFFRDNTGLRLQMNKEVSENMKPESSGFVYIFNKDDFTKRNEIEYISYKMVASIDFAKVKFSDLLKKVEVIPN